MFDAQDRPASKKAAPKKKTTYVPPKKAPVSKPKTTYKAPAKASSSSSSSSGGSSGGGSSGGGGGGIKKSNDKPQRDALKDLLSSGFKDQLTIKLASINTSYLAGDAGMMKGYAERTGVLQDSKDANDKAEAASSQANLGNRARETADILANAAAQGAGETDTLRAKEMTLRNWAANQVEVTRAYHDTLASNNAAVTELNADTWQSRFNLANQMLGDTEQVYSNYYNQMSDAATQLGNLYSNPYSNAYSSSGAKEAFKQMKENASKSWANPGVDAAIKDWQGTMQADKTPLNATILQQSIDKKSQQKRPEGNTLQEW
mgnify:CR=1 FL=1